MKKKLLGIICFMLLSYLAFAGSDDKEKTTWYEIAGTMLALLTTVVGLALSISQVKISRPSNEKLKLEIESLKLDIEEKKLKFQKHLKPVPETVPDEKKYQDFLSEKLPHNYAGVWGFSKLTIGFLAIMFPAVLVIGSMFIGDDTEIRGTVSDYYYSTMRDVYVGTHLVIAVILFSYVGYTRTDYLVTKIQGLFCLLIGFCPTATNSLLNIIHSISFALFMISHSYFSIFLFTKSSGYNTKAKMLRNRAYRICGYMILICLILVILYYFISYIFSAIQPYKPVFFLESIMYWAFGTSWLLKGGYIFKDRAISQQDLRKDVL